MEEKKERYKLILEEGDVSFAEKKMNQLAEQGYRFVEMKTTGTGPCFLIAILMEKED